MMRMETPKHILGVIVLVLLFKGVVPEVEVEVKVKEAGGKVTLECTTGSQNAMRWTKDEIVQESNKSELGLGPELNDPRGIYKCEDMINGNRGVLQVYYRMCQSCIEFNPGTISGLLVADVIATALIAFAVYCVTRPDKGRSSRASDKQTLIQHEQLYQPLGDRGNSEYSHLSTARTRK
ncbi:T-cell surface glycoprotein CD3 delta chain [Rhinatrema bivittatum]|uniref:T-cell surface glycoprotein CD3 delta chain n=1 Tax=Rhinatrema bivittatum TaxID=194408 RepID=UPI0011276753|nr:T-cell surface glycoprotein CD3 delta chain [Rhinatrema bivittatum]